MLNNSYNRVKQHLNSKRLICFFFLILFSLFVPTMLPRENYNFFFNLIYNYQYYISSLFTIFLLIVNTTLYIKKNINFHYQVHRYGTQKKIMLENIKDIILITIIMEIVCFLLNVSFSIIFVDGIQNITFKYSHLSITVYLIYFLVVRIITMFTINMYVYIMHYKNTITSKIILIILLVSNVFIFSEKTPFLLSSYLYGANFKSFTGEVLNFVLCVLMWWIVLFIITKNNILKKRDI